jgi:hypothetical protein
MSAFFKPRARFRRMNLQYGAKLAVAVDQTAEFPSNRLGL